MRGTLTRHMFPAFARIGAVESGKTEKLKKLGNLENFA